MTCNFRVGQKVVCVDDALRTYRDGELIRTSKTVLTEGEVYTVESVVRERGFYLGRFQHGYKVILSEVENPNGNSWNPARFRPLVERKTDISIFKAMLEDKKSRADA